MPRITKKSPKKRGKKNGGSSGSLCIQNVRKYVAQDLVATHASVGTTWVLADVAQIAGGTDIVNRVGRRLRVLTGRVAVSLAGGQSNLVTDDVYNSVRLVVVLASDTLVAADWATILLRTPAVVGLWPKVRRFLLDKTVVLSTYGPDSVGYVNKVVRREFTVPVNITLEWDGVNATDHSSNTLYFAMISDSAAVSHPGLVEPSLFYAGFTDF
jgi:hypothetical protein